MKHNYIITSLAFVLLLPLGLTGCAEFSDGYSNPHGGYGGYDSRDDYYTRRERERVRRERWEVEKEQDRLEDERRRLEEERRRDARRYNPPPQEHCPSGFHPSEQKCSKEERRHGCKDMRLSNGLGCVKR